MEPERLERAGGARLWSVFYGVLIILLAALPAGMYRLHRQALERLGRSLSRGTGMQVSIVDLWATLTPSLVLQQVKVGSGAMSLEADRVELLLDWRRVIRLWMLPEKGARVVEGLRLGRPTVNIDAEQMAPRPTLRAEAQAPIPARPGASPRRERPGFAMTDLRSLTIEDGRLRLRFHEDGREIALQSQGIFLHPTQEGRRLLLGRTMLFVDGRSLLDLPSAAAELASHQGILPRRLAAMGGRLDILNENFDIHLLLINRGRGRSTVEVKGATRHATPGRFQLQARLEALNRPSSVTDLALSFSEIDLGFMQPLMAGLHLGLPGARLSGVIELTQQNRRRNLRFRIHSPALTVAQPLLSHAPIGPFPLELAGSAWLDPRARTLAVPSMTLRSGPIQLRLNGAMQVPLPGVRQVSLDLDLEPLGCQTLLQALPPGLAPTLRGMVLSGEIRLQGRLRLRSDRLDETLVSLGLDRRACRVLVDPKASDVNALRGPITLSLPGPNGRPVSLRLGPENPDFLKFGEIGKMVRGAFLAAEDTNFLLHDGFDDVQLRRAFISNLQAGRTMRGASTISQQLVKNIFLHQRRTLARKFEEAVLTWRLEQRLPKWRILELYLNLVELGPGLRGVGPAARRLFERDPVHLNPLQAAHLAAITPSPRRYPLLDGNGRPTPEWTARLHQILRHMQRAGLITPAQQQKWQETEIRLKK